MRSPVYRAPLDAGSDAWLEQRWHALGGDDGHRDAGITIDGRRIGARAQPRHGVVRFDALCEGPRGASDYIEVAQEFHTVLLGGVPVFDETDATTPRAASSPWSTSSTTATSTGVHRRPRRPLYAGERLAVAFERCASRLTEMQSAEYFAAEHQA